MKSRKKIILILACVVVAALSALVLSSCSLNRLSIDDLIQKGYDYTVKFDLQGGKSNDNGYLYVQVAEGSYLPKPGTVTGNGAIVYQSPTKSGYHLLGYFQAEKDEEGNDIVDDEGNVTYGEEWDFGTDTVTSNMTLYAKWQENYSLILYYGDDFSYTIEVALTISEDGIFTAVGSTSVKISEFKTVVGYYLDKDFSPESEIFFPYTPTLDLFDDAEEEGVLKVYAHTILEKYTVVSKASNLSTFYDATNIYLKNDVDMTGVTVTFPEAYSGTFLGNGYTISNLTVTQTANRAYNNYGLFRQIISGASITDVTFENLTVNVTLDNPTITSYRVGLLAGYINSDVTLSNVIVSGTLNVTYTSAVWDSETIIVEVDTLCADLNSGVILTDCKYDDIVINYINSDEQTTD